jgi:hypothetical protein
MKTFIHSYDRLTGIVHLLILFLFTILLSAGRLIAKRAIKNTINQGFFTGYFLHSFVNNFDFNGQMPAGRQAGNIHYYHSRFA